MPEDRPEMSFRFDQPSPEELAAGQTPPAERPGLPWERRRELGMIPAFLQTFINVLVKPKRTFSEMLIGRDVLSAWLFFIALVVVATVVQVGMSFAFEALNLPFQQSPWSNQQMNEFEKQWAEFLTPLVMAMMIPVAPIVATVGIAIIAFLSHVVLMLMPGGNKGYETTFKVFCYAGGATQILSLLPCCGGIVALVWQLVATALGLAAAHETSETNGILAAVLPIVLCCSCMALVIGTAIFAALHHFS